MTQYTPSEGSTDDWKMKIGQGEAEDLTWLIK